MKDPRSTTPGSVMPRYPHLLTDAYDVAPHRRRRCARSAPSGRPYTDGEIESAPAAIDGPGEGDRRRGRGAAGAEGPRRQGDHRRSPPTSSASAPTSSGRRSPRRRRSRRPPAAPAPRRRRTGPGRRGGEVAMLQELAARTGATAWAIASMLFFLAVWVFVAVRVFRTRARGARRAGPPPPRGGRRGHG